MPLCSSQPYPFSLHWWRSLCSVLLQQFWQWWVFLLPRVELWCGGIYRHVCQLWNLERGRRSQVLVPANIVHFSLIYIYTNKQLGSKHRLTLPGRPSETQPCCWDLLSTLHILGERGEVLQECFVISSLLWFWHRFIALWPMWTLSLIKEIKVFLPLMQTTRELLGSGPLVQGPRPSARITPRSAVELAVAFKRTLMRRFEELKSWHTLLSITNLQSLVIKMIAT